MTGVAGRAGGPAGLGGLCGAGVAVAGCRWRVVGAWE